MLAATSGDSDGLRAVDLVEQIRRRPSMYVGSASEHGLLEMVWALLSRALGPVMHGAAKRVHVVVHADESVSVTDDAPGFDLGVAAGCFAANEAFTAFAHPPVTFKTFPGDPPAGDPPPIALSLGVPVAVVNALSSRFLLSTNVAGTGWEQEWSGGLPDGAPRRTHTDLASGTIVRFWPDRDIFGGAPIQVDAITSRLRDLNWLVPDLEATLTVEDHGFPPSEGMAGLVMSRVQANFGENGRMHHEVLELAGQRAGSSVHIGLFWTSSPRITPALIQGYCNLRECTAGGTHRRGFEAGLAKALEIEASPEVIEIVTSGLVAVINLVLPSPDFGGPTKTRLDSPDAETLVREVTVSSLPPLLATTGPAAASGPSLHEQLLRRVAVDPRSSA